MDRAHKHLREPRHIPKCFAHATNDPLLKLRSGLLSKCESDDVPGLQSLLLQEMNNVSSDDFCLAGSRAGNQLEVCNPMLYRPILRRCEFHVIAPRRHA